MKTLKKERGQTLTCWQINDFILVSIFWIFYNEHMLLLKSEKKYIWKQLFEDTEKRKFFDLSVYPSIDGTLSRKNKWVK